MILSLDLGSTSFKAAVYDRRLKLRAQAGVKPAYEYGGGGQVELKPSVCENAVKDAIKHALAAAGIKPESLMAVSVASQAQTFAVFAPSGKPKTRFLSWQDARSARQAALLSRNKSMLNFAAHSSFRHIEHGLQLAQIKRLRQEQPGLIKPDDKLLLLPAGLIWKLSGSLVTDDNLAAMSGLYSLRMKRWWPAALGVCALRNEQLPEVRAVGTAGAFTSSAARAFGLPAGVPIVLAGNDQTAGAYGARLHETGSVLLTLGTAHALYACVSKPVRPGSAPIRGPYPGGRYYRMAADSCGGNVIIWAAKALGLQTNEFFDIAATAPDGCRGAVFNPELPCGAGSWSGLALLHTRADMARSVVEAMARRAASMARAAGLRSNHCGVALAGGSSRHPIWRELLNRALGSRVEPVQGEPLTGAAAMAQSFLRAHSATTGRIGGKMRFG